MCPSGFERIVVGIDGSDVSVRALDWAAARLPAGGDLYALQVAGSQADRITVHRRLDQVCSETVRRTDITVYPTVNHGDPAASLLTMASDRGLDALVVGAHGAGEAGRRSPFLGRVVRKLLHRSTLPLIVHHRSDRGNDGPVICCVGYGPPAEAAAHWAADHAVASKRPLVLLHAVSYRPFYPVDSPIDMLAGYLGPGVDRDWARADLAELRHEILARVGELDISTKVVQGSAIRAIVTAGSGAAPGNAAELVVVGRHMSVVPLPPSPRLHQIIAQAKCPTAVIPSCSRDEPERQSAPVR